MVKAILRILKLQMLVLFLTIASHHAYASHAMGADLTYTCLGGNTYKLTLSFYRDCIGIAAPANVFININSASCGQTLGITCNPIPGTGQEVTPTCPSAQSTCNGGVFTGIQEWVYEGIVTLPMQCTDWVFSYNLCCRNAAINTITTPGSNTFYIYATLNNVISPCNSSPTFSNKPVPFICMGQQFCFNHGAFDADGDSLYYQLITPYQTASTNVNYIGPYTATQPLNSSPPLAFNNTTGDVCMTPQQIQVTVMAVLVKEYRNGVLIGTVERDIQITVINCTNNNPTLTGINGTNQFSATICAGQPYCFDIFSNDPDAGQNLYVSWNNAIPGATFTTAGSPHPTGHFCWTPQQSDISNTPYCFTVRVHDDACPYVGSQIYSYCLTVIGVNVNLGPDQNIACNDLATLIANASGGSGVYTYQWSNGSTMPAQTVPVGTYIVTVSDGTCSASDTVVVQNTNVPTANFSPFSGCINNPIPFIDQSVVPGGFIITWNWNFGDGTTSTLQNPVHQFPGPGTYNVTLIIETNLGCIDTVVQPVVINPIPLAAFSAPSGCVGETVTFTDQTTPAGSVNSWSWDLGNGTTSGQQNPTTTYAGPGTYTVTLIAGDSSGCIDTVSQQITINPLPSPDFTYSYGCVGTTVTFTDLSGGTNNSWNWTFGDGGASALQNPTHTYSGPGTYSVSLAVGNSFGCYDTITKSVTINPLPLINAGPDQSVCVGQSVTLTASGGVTYSWTPGGTTTGSISVTPGTTTTYTVVGTDMNGCTSTDMMTVTVNPLPVANAGPDQSICAGQSATLTATGGTSFQWSPTGDVTGTIVVTPANTTTYAVTVIDANGCQATDFVDVVVHNPPVVNLPSASFICSGTNAVLDAGNPGATFQWSNGATSQTISVTTAGTYTVTVTNQYGCTATASSAITVGNSVTVNLGNISFCQGDSSTLDAGHPGASYQWSTGAASQTITVFNPGTYTVTVTESNGCTGTLAVTVNVNPLPQANFNYSGVCEGSATSFTDLTAITAGSVSGWSWNFGDGNFSTQQNPVHTYTSAGTYTVILTSTSAAGCVSSVTRNVDVYPLPTAAFTASDACLGSAISFTDQSNVLIGNITQWSWDFGDNTTSNSQNPSHVYNIPGTYNVTLQVTTAGGCVATIINSVTIYSLPVAGFNANTVCLNAATIFNNTSAGTISSSSWDFGDGNTSGQSQPAHTYSTAGTFNVTLVVTSNYGCTDTISQQVTVNPLPNANAGADQTICNGASVTLTATGGTTYSWTPGNTAIAAINVNPAVTTTYTVNVTDNNGCSASDSVRVNVNALPAANAGTDQTICAGASANLSASGGSSYRWSTGATTSAISVSPNVTTNYIVTVTDNNGCSKADTVKVNVNPSPNADAGLNQTICNGQTATLTATGGTTYYWSPGGSTSAVIYVNPTLNTTYYVLVTDSNGCQANDSMNVTVNPLPVVNLSNTFVCPGNNATLDAGNPGATYLWSPNGEVTQTITVATAGTYGVLVTNANGCASYSSCQVTVGGTISTNSANVVFCDGNSDTLDAGNPGSTYLWSNGSTNQSIIVTTPGSYTVTITDPNGCTGGFVTNVVVNPLPVAAFNPVSNCLNAATVFNNQSSVSQGNIMFYHWDFGDGAVSPSQNPTHLYNSSGTYNVTLQITSGSGCPASVSHPVTVYPEPAADFTATTVCQNASTSFSDKSNISSGTVTVWSWDFGDGNTSNNQNPSHKYANAGSYKVKLIVSSNNGCNDTITKQVDVNPLPAADFAAASVCNSLVTNFTNNSMISNGNITSYSWNFGDGSTSNLNNPSHSYTTAGSYNITLIAYSAFGCSDTVTKSIDVFPKPVPSFNAASACVSDSVAFNNTSLVSTGTISSYYWIFGDGGSSNVQNPAHHFSNPGTYNVTLAVITNNGCTDSITQPVTVYPKPVADFITQDVCVSGVAQFTDNSSVPGCNITAWAWDFGDGSFSAQQNPSHQYATAGTYAVSLIATSCNGCRDTIKRSINIWALPTVDFAAISVCLSDLTQFYNLTTIGGGGSTFTYSWDFGDGSTATLQDPTHIYQASGLFNVTLTATSNNGCVSTLTKPVDVYAPPIASFKANDVCQNVTEIFPNNSVSNGSPIVSWLWDFGDGTTNTSEVPGHSYSMPGNYQVSLTVTNGYGCSNRYMDSLKVFANPTPIIAAGDNCEDQALMISNPNASADNFVAWQWDLGNGTQASDSAFSFTYTQAGTYTITLLTTNQYGCQSATQKTVTIYPNPVAEFDAGDACQNSTVNFNNQTSIPSGIIGSYLWNFGDGSPVSSSINPVHTYTTPGTYTVWLTATSDHGCEDSVAHIITIYPLPVSHFNSINQAGCIPEPVTFLDSSYVPGGGNIISWIWDFGDGSTSTDQNPVHTYTQSGVYTVGLTITTDKGCTQTFSIPNYVTIFPGPTADFEPDPAVTDIYDMNIDFDNLSAGAISYYWDFGDGTTSNLFEPNHTYGDTGTFYVMLVVMNKYGCLDTIIKPVRINPVFSLWIPNAFTPNSDGMNDYFTISGLGIVDATINIYNRWGSNIYITEDYQKGWDGTDQQTGKNAQQDVYVYAVTVKDVFGKKHNEYGRVTLVR